MAKLPTKQTITQPETEPMVKINVRVPKSVDRAAEFAAVQQETTKQHIVEMALRAYLRIGVAA